MTYPVSPIFIFHADMKFLAAFMGAFKGCQPSCGVEKPIGTPFFEELCRKITVHVLYYTYYVIIV